MSADLCVRYKARESVVARRIGDETILVPVCGELADLQQVYTLNAVAELVWKLLDGEHTLDDVCTRVVSEFDVDAAQAEQDITALIDEFQELNLIDPHGAHNSPVTEV
jgi:hypothetical protein